MAEENGPGARILSAYVSLTPDRVDGRKFLISTANEIRRIRETLATGEDRSRFDRAAARVEEYLASLEPAGAGVAVFVSEPPGIWRTVLLAEPPEDHVSWSGYPAVMPWMGMVDEGRRFAVTLVDKERARLLAVLMGQVEESVSFEDEVPAKQEQGGWSQARYQRHHEDHVQRHIARAVRELTSLRERRPFERLVIGGPDEALQTLRERLPGELAALVVGTVVVELFAPDHEVAAAAWPAVEAHERAREAGLVEELITDAEKGGQAVLGGPATVSALVEGRVHTVYLIDGESSAVIACTGCGRIAEGDGPCAWCGATGRRSVRLGDLAVVQARATSAEVECVRGVAATTLAASGGIGARLRY